LPLPGYIPTYDGPPSGAGDLVAGVDVRPAAPSRHTLWQPHLGTSFRPRTQVRIRETQIPPAPSRGPVIPYSMLKQNCLTRRKKNAATHGLRLPTARSPSDWPGLIQVVDY